MANDPEEPTPSTPEPAGSFGLRQAAFLRQRNSPLAAALPDDEIGENEEKAASLRVESLKEFRERQRNTV